MEITATWKQTLRVSSEVRATWKLIVFPFVVFSVQRILPVTNTNVFEAQHKASLVILHNLSPNFIRRYFFR